MNASLEESRSARVEAFLSGAYSRMRRTTIVLGVAAALAASLLFNWRSGLGLAMGALAGYINFVWLHRASTMMVDRMVAPTERPPSKFRLVLAFAGRYIFVMAMAYAIFKSQPRMLAGFTAALFFPVMAAICEGVYEVFASSHTSEI